MSRFARVAWMVMALAAAVAIPAAPAFAQWEVQLQPGGKALSAAEWAAMNAAFTRSLTKAAALGTFEQVRALGALTYGAVRAGGLDALATAAGVKYGPDLFEVGLYDLDYDGRVEMFVRARPPVGACNAVTGCEIYVLQKDGPLGGDWQVMGWFSAFRVRVYPNPNKGFEVIDDGVQRWIWNGTRFDRTCNLTCRD